MFPHLNKKGVSPLVSTVLLIVFSIALATIILSWLTTYTSTTTESAGSTSAQLVDCSKAAITVDSVYATGSGKNITKVDVRNSGLIAINATSVVTSSSTSSCVHSGSASKLSVGDIRSYTNSSCQVACNDYAQTRVTTECGSATAVHSSNITIIGCK